MTEPNFAVVLHDNGLEVPNLDDMTTNPGELNEAAIIFDTLARFCNYKALAMRFRLAGSITEAQMYEKECEGAYKRLPDWAKW